MGVFWRGKICMMFNITAMSIQDYITESIQQQEENVRLALEKKLAEEQMRKEARRTRMYDAIAARFPIFTKYLKSSPEIVTGHVDVGVHEVTGELNTLYPVTLALIIENKYLLYFHWQKPQNIPRIGLALYPGENNLMNVENVVLAELERLDKTNDSILAELFKSLDDQT